MIITIRMPYVRLFSRKGIEMAVTTPAAIDNHHALEDAIAEVHDELYRLADYMEAGNYNEARDSKRSVEAYLTAIDQYINTVAGQEE